MAFGLGVLRLSAGDFWAMTLPELNAALRGVRGDAGHGDPLDRAGFEALIAHFPDIERNGDGDDFG